MPDDAEDEKPETDSTDVEDKSDTDVWVDRDKIDFDPDDGLLTGTAIEGGTDIPGPHENVDDVLPDEDDSADDKSEDSDADDGSVEDRPDEDGSDDEES